jgi:predicted RNA-binding protein with PIN domain
MAEPTLYLFDGFNLLHAGDYRGVEQLVDELASFVALQGARGVVVFDGHGQDVTRGPLEVRYAPDADTLLERLAAENRDSASVCLVSSDLMIRETSGREVRKLSSKTFLRDLAEPSPETRPPGQLSDRLDDETRARLERLRRGEKD